MYEEQGPDDMKSEYPSCIEEFPLFARGILFQARDAASPRRQADRAADAVRPVPPGTFWDIGMDDENCIWFHQTDGVRRRMIDFYSNSGEGLPHYIPRSGRTGTAVC